MGAVTMITGITILLFALLQMGIQWSWMSPQFIGLIIVAFAFFGIFIWVEMRAKEPILPLSMIKRPMILVANICALITGGITVGASSFLPTFAQGVLGVTAVVAGGTIVTLSIGWPIASTLSGKLIWRYGYRSIEVVGMVLCIIASIMYLEITTTSSPIYMALCSFVMGAGLGLASTTQIVSVQSSVHWKQRGIATGSVMFSRILGSTLLVALLGTVVNTSLATTLAKSPLTRLYKVSDSVSITNLLLDPARRATIAGSHLKFLTDALAHGIHLTFWLILISSVIGTIAAFRTPRGVPDKHGQLAHATNH